MAALGLDDATTAEIISRLGGPPLVGILESVDPDSSTTKKRGATCVFAGCLEAAGRSVAIHVGLPALFPYQLPLVHLVNPGELGRLPHLETDGHVCYAQAEGAMLDVLNPTGIVREALKRTADTISAGVEGRNRQDFTDEFEAYWQRLENHLQTRAFVTPGNSVQEVVAQQASEQNAGFAWVGDSEEEVRAFRGSECLDGTVVNALYIPLEKGTLLRPPELTGMWSLQGLQDVVWGHVSSENKRRLDRLTQKHKTSELLILRLPRPSGGETLFGVWCRNVEQAHPLHPEGQVEKIVPILLKRRDRAYLLPRGGADTTLADRRVAIIGCGAVGSQIALELARLGVLNLTLVDHDCLSPENIFRHTVGKQMLGQPKVKALKEDIECKLPYTRVRAIAERAEKALDDGLLVPGTVDLIIIAIGDVQLGRYFNRRLHDEPKCPPVIFSWLEPYGIGGHTLVTRNGDPKGCFECLYTPTGGDLDALHDRSSFAAPGQSFGKDISGCGSLFMPFSFLDATRTAALTVQAAGNVLLGRETGNPLLSWKGESTDFVAASYQVSARYILPHEELHERRYSYINPLCPTCGSGN